MRWEGVNLWILHTADWHLGCSFYGASLLDDQRYVLDQLVALAKDAKPSVILISGDIYRSRGAARGRRQASG